MASSNNKGFSHHFILPILVIFAVASIGGYVMLKGSSAASKPCVSKVFTKSSKKTDICLKYVGQLVKTSHPSTKYTDELASKAYAYYWQYDGVMSEDFYGTITKIDKKFWQFACRDMQRESNKSLFGKLGCITLKNNVMYDKNKKVIFCSYTKKNEFTALYKPPKGSSYTCKKGANNYPSWKGGVLGKDGTYLYCYAGAHLDPVPVYTANGQHLLYYRCSND